MLLPGLCATDEPVSASRRMSSWSSQTPCPTVKSGPSRADILQMRGRCLAVFLQPDDDLRLRLLDMGVQDRGRFSRASAAQARMKSSEQWFGMVGRDREAGPGRGRSTSHAGSA